VLLPVYRRKLQAELLAAARVAPSAPHGDYAADLKGDLIASAPAWPAMFEGHGQATIDPTTNKQTAIGSEESTIYDYYVTSCEGINLH
jgi:hypothetical protein